MERRRPLGARLSVKHSTLIDHKEVLYYSYNVAIFINIHEPRESELIEKENKIRLEYIRIKIYLTKTNVNK